MIRILLLLALTALFAQNEPECDQEALRNNVIKGLSDPNYYFLKTFPARRKGEVSYVFTKGSTYLITLCSQANSVSVKISDHERRVKIDTEQAVNQDRVCKILYECPATGIYYITFSNSADACTSCGLAFKKQS